MTASPSAHDAALQLSFRSPISNAVNRLVAAAEAPENSIFRDRVKPINQPHLRRDRARRWLAI